jgi:hypothetical protein
MCAKCCNSRTQPLKGKRTSRIEDVGTARGVGAQAILNSHLTAREQDEVREIARKMFERDLARLKGQPLVKPEEPKRKCVHGYGIDHCGKEVDVQNLNVQLDPRIQAILNKRR